MRKIDRTPCKRCRCYAGLHVGMTCYGVKTSGRCTCPGFVAGVDREQVAVGAVCVLIVLVIGAAFGVPWK